MVLGRTFLRSWFAHHSAAARLALGETASGTPIQAGKYAVPVFVSVRGETSLDGVGFPRRYHDGRLIPNASHGRVREADWARGLAPAARRLAAFAARLRSFRRASRSAFGTSKAPMVVMPKAVRIASVSPRRLPKLSAVQRSGRATTRSASVSAS